MKKLVIKFADQILIQHTGPEADLLKWLEEEKNKYPIGAIVEIWDYSYEYELAECIGKRVSEYPTPSDFLNAYFDGKEEALHDLELKRLAVKAKYPKPQPKENTLIESVVLFPVVEPEIVEEQPLPEFMD